MTTINKNVRHVTFFRSSSFLNESQVGLAEFMSKTKQSIGGYWASTQSKAQGTGLTQSEIRMLLPAVLDIHPDDREFRPKVKEFYEGINTTVPFKQGVTLNIGLENNEEELAADNLPLEVMDYIRYRHALGHPEVAKNKDAAIGNQLIKFYMHNPEEVKNQGTDLRDKRREAMALYIALSTDVIKVDNVLALYGKDTRTFNSLGDKLEFLETKTQSKELKDILNFITIAEDRQLETKGIINRMVTTGILKNVGTRFVLTETNAIIADDLDAMVIELQDEEKNGELILSLKAKLQQEMGKKVATKKK